MTHALISKGLLTQNQITKALEYQCRLPPGQFQPLSRILLEFEYITEAQLRDALGEDYLQNQDPIGQILVEQGLVSLEQLNQALEILNSFPLNHVADVLVDMGFATRVEVEQAISRHQVSQSERLHQAISPVLEPHVPAAEAPAETFSAPSPVEQAVVHLPLGRKLIAKGYLSEDELRDAIEYQQRLPRVMHKPIGEILVQMGYLTAEQLKEVLSQEAPRGTHSRIGELLIRAGLIEEWQLAHALSLQFSPAHAQKKLGSLLVELGYAQRDEIEGVLARHYREQPAPPVPEARDPIPAPAPAPHRPLGQVLVEKGYITPDQLSEALAHQGQLATEYKPLGDILVLMGYLSEAQLQESLAEQPRFGHEPIGQILLKQGLIAEWQLSHALCMQFDPARRERINLGAVLVELGYATQEEIEEAVLNHFRQRRQQGHAEM
ncbi:MAG: hypothetical protein ACO1RX_16900 [Candidatus Sericytochromatia bacterium]